MMNSLTSMRTASLFTVALGVLVGCSSSTTTTGTGAPTATADAGPGAAKTDGGTTITASGDSGTTSTSACPVDTGSDSCGTCIGQKCCSQLTACQADADCKALDGCLNKCPDPTTQAGKQCGDACYAAHPTGAKIADTIDACGGANCKAVCN